MGDRCPHLKKVLDCIRNRKFGEISHVDSAKRELSIVFQAQPSINPRVQREFIKFLEVADSQSPGEIVKFKNQHDISSYDQIIQQYENQLENKSNGSKKMSAKSSANKSNQSQSEGQPNPDITSESNKLAMKDLEINELQTRLSKVAGERLRDNNPNITDLSDVNRPTKLAEKFKEMYDNEWIRAYESLQNAGIKNEEEIVKKLSKILKLAFDFCLRQAKEHRAKIRETLVYPAGVHATINANVEPNIEKILSPKVRQIQRETGVHAIPAIQEMFRLENENEIKRNELDESKEISLYIMNCVRICWLFAIQDPPMKLHWPKEETAMDEHVVAYTKRGTRIKFVVWPTLYLHDRGPLMTKGVAQPL